MTTEVLYDSILSKELHILVHEATDLPIIINHPMITEMHKVIEPQIPDMSLLGGLGMGMGMGVDTNAVQNLVNESGIVSSDERAFKVMPTEVQGSDWIWETTKGQLRFSGIVNKEFGPFEMDFWLT